METADYLNYPVDGRYPSHDGVAVDRLPPS